MRTHVAGCSRIQLLTFQTSHIQATFGDLFRIGFMAIILIHLLNYSGLVSIVLSLALFSWSWVVSGLSLKSNVLCDCGSNKCSKIFNPALSIFGTLQVIFTWVIINKFLLAPFHWIILPPLMAGLMVLGLSVFDNAKHKPLHEALGYSTFIILSVWAIIFSLMLGTANNFIGFVSGIIATFLALGTLIAYRKYRLCAIPELVFILGVFIWNIFFTYSIFFL